MLLQNRYQRVKRIGEGAYGIVYKALDCKPEVSKAVCQIPKESHEKPPFSPLVQTLSDITITKSKPIIEEPSSENTNPNSYKQSEESKITSSKQEYVAIKKLRIHEVKFSLNFA